MSEIKEYKCPSCGAPMHYDINNESVTCRFCLNKYDQEYFQSHFEDEIDEKLSDFDWVDRTKYVWEPYETDKLEKFVCSSCGGKIITKSFYASAKCPYCKHYVIISSDLDGDIRPDKVIPFKVTKKEFWDKYTSYISGVKKAPKEFYNKSVQKNIVGYYVPVWRYSCTYKPEESYVLNLKDYPILANDADVKEKVFYSLMPFEFSDAEDFTESCLAGFCASRYIIGAENAMKMVDYVLKKMYNDETNPQPKKEEKPLDTGNRIDKLLKNRLNKYVQNRELSYYLVPVWLLKIIYKNEELYYAMNGQTGQMYADRIPKRIKKSKESKESEKDLIYWMTVLIILLIPIILLAPSGVFNYKVPLTAVIIQFISFLIIVVDYLIAKRRQRKTTMKKVFFKAKGYKEAKIWSIKDFIKKP